MKRKSSIVLVIASITLVLGIVLTGISFIITGGFFSLNWNFTDPPEVSHYALLDTPWSEKNHDQYAASSAEETVVFDSFTSIEAGVVSANIELIPSNEYKIEYKLSSTEKIKQCEVTADGTLKFKLKSTTGISWFNFGVGFKDNYLKIYYKSSAEFDDVILSTVSGNITAPNTTADTFELTSVSGTISGNDFIGRKGSFSSTSGNIKLSSLSISDSISLTTTSGGVEVDKVKGATDISASTVSGEITLDDCENVGRVNANTVSDTIVLNGDFKSADLSSISGDVEVNASNPQDSYTTNLSSLSGDCDVNNESSKGRRGNGNDVISANTTSGNIDINFAR